MLHCFCYLASTKELKLQLKPLSSTNCQLQFFSNATWEEDHHSRKSQSGYICLWKSCPISWYSSSQRNIATSSTNLKLNLLSEANQENKWITNLIQKLWKIKLVSTLFHIDNYYLLDKIKVFGSHSKTKHLDIKAKYLQKKLKTKEIDIKLISSQAMIADGLTKVCSRTSLDSLLKICFAC